MTVYGFRHLSRLRESNARIHRLSADVDSYERNKLYLKELEDEYCELQRQLADVTERWNSEYVPAMEKRQLLLRELDFARNHPELYYANICDALRGAHVDVLRRRIAELAQPELQDVSCRASTAEELAKENSANVRVASLKTNRGSEDAQGLQEESDFATSRSSTRPKHYRSWNLSDTSKRVDELESVRTQIKGEMGAIGAQTCALTVKLRKAENEIASLRNAMSLPHEHLYMELKRELAEYKIEAIRRLLRARAECKQPESPRLASQVTTSSSNAPSLAYSIGTISTDISSIGMEFLKATQNSLCDIEAKFL